MIRLLSLLRYLASPLRVALVVGFGALLLPPASAQWITQTNQLKAGWNAVALFVDASHAPISDVMPADGSIEEVWLWKPSSTQQFIDSPQVPTGTGSQWSKWTFNLGPSSELQRLIPNASYYVKVKDSAATYQWLLKGKPVAPQYAWTSSGLNFIGFPVPDGTMGYERFFQPVPSLLETAEIYRSPGGAFGSGNPARVFDTARTVFSRGEAVWMRMAAGYNRYFGPFEVSLSGNRSIQFGKSGTQAGFRLRNQSRSTNVITLRLLPSETAPSGQTAVVGLPPLILRGELDPSTLKYNGIPLSTNAGGNVTWTLPPQGRPGSDVQVVLGLARDEMVGQEGDLSACILRLTDEAGLLQVDLGVGASKAANTGLWVGEARVTRVVQYLKTFERDPVGNPVVRLTEEDGAYSVLVTNEVAGGVSRPFPMRLIVHNDGTNSVFLQRVFLGLDPQTNAIVTTQQRFLDPAQLGSARRISAAHLPWSAQNIPWPMTLTSNVSRVEISTPYDSPSVNPFIHQYHPDHDNLNASFSQVLPKGRESYSVKRTVWLSQQAAGLDYQSRTSGSLDRNGVYDETIEIGGSGSNARTFRVLGTYTLNRISDLPILTR
ncbi:MAG: hypothetical protein LW626_06680 [Verrucomicrobium sp.]|jgi:hypothetical protein|nr:hypothetical protein [Verrucomicrobium sp.]